MAIDATHPVPPQFPRIAGRENIPAHVPKELIRSVGLTFGGEFLAAITASATEAFVDRFVDVLSADDVHTLRTAAAKIPLPV